MQGGEATTGERDAGPSKASNKFEMLTLDE